MLGCDSSYPQLVQNWCYDTNCYILDMVDTKIVMNNRNCKVNVMNKTKKNYKGFHNPLNDNF